MAEHNNRPIKDITGKEILSDEKLDKVRGGMRPAGGDQCKCRCSKKESADRSGTKSAEYTEEVC